MIAWHPKPSGSQGLRTLQGSMDGGLGGCHGRGKQLKIEPTLVVLIQEDLLDVIHSA